MKCKMCGYENPEGSKFCASCGSKLEDEGKKVCKKCGAVNPSTSIYCNICGASLDGEYQKEEEKGIKCRICGNVNPEGEMYCKLCGSQLSTSSSSYNTSYNAREENNGGSSSLVLGIVSLVSSLTCCLFIVGVICGAIGIIISIRAIAKKRSNGKVIAGLILSILGLLLGLFVLISYVYTLNNPELVEELRKSYYEALNEGY